MTLRQIEQSEDPPRQQNAVRKTPYMQRNT